MRDDRCFDVVSYLMGRRALYGKLLDLYPTDTITNAAAAIFPDGADDVPVIALACAFDPVQNGSGTPSPENIRRFDGFSYIIIYSSGRLVPASPLLQITQQPADQTGAIGDTVSFHVEATGSDLSYQWQWFNTATKSWEKYSSYTDDTLTLEITEARLASAYRCRIRERGGMWRYGSQPRMIEAVPAITQQPPTMYANVGDTVSFHVEAEGDGLSYQWQIRTSEGTWADAAMNGAQTDTLTVPVTEETLNSAFRCSITDGDGSYTSATAFLFQGTAERRTPWVQIPISETVYAGTLDVLTGALTVTWGHIAAYAGETLPGEWLSDRDEYAPGATPTTGAEVVYKLDDPYVIQCVPVEARTALGDSSFAAGVMTSAGGVWTSNIAVSVSYRADVEKYIEKKIGEGS